MEVDGRQSSEKEVDLNIEVKLFDWGREGHRTEAKIALLRSTLTQEVGVRHKLEHPKVLRLNQIPFFESNRANELHTVRIMVESLCFLI